MNTYNEIHTLYNQKQYQYAYERINFEIMKHGNYDKSMYLLYGNILRKLNKSNDFLKKIKPLIKSNIFKIDDFSGLICWCIYDCYIKNFDGDFDNDFINKVNFIVSKCYQLDIDRWNFNPFVLSIFKTAKLLDSLQYNGYGKTKYVINLLEKIDPLKLPHDNEKKYIDKTNTERIDGSTREKYYVYLSKFYEKIEDYKKVYELCCKALNDNIKFHHDNHIWLNNRKLYSECKISDNFDVSITEYIKFAEKINKWFIYWKISNLFLSHNLLEEALYYACFAFELSNDMQMKCNLMSDLGDILFALNYEDDAIQFYQACLFYRLRSGWYIDNELDYKRRIYDLKNEKPNLDLMKKVTIKHIIRLKKHNIGIVKKLFKDKGYGFICSLNENIDVYFKIPTSGRNSKIGINSYVIYDEVKNEKGKIANNIRII